MIDVDVVEPDGMLAKPHLAGVGLADFDRFPLRRLGPAGGVDADRVGHLDSVKKGPAGRGSGRASFKFSLVA